MSAGSDEAADHRQPSDAELVRALAVEHLPPGDVGAWTALLRPAIQLMPSAAASVPVARLGGHPLLPEDVDWPHWPDTGPLSYIGELFCPGLASFTLDIPVPSNGRLLFFYFDGSYDNGISTVGTWDAATLQGARVLHVPDTATCSRRDAPWGVRVYTEQNYKGRAIVTAPGWEHPSLARVFRSPDEDLRSFMDHPVNADAFVEALHERHTVPLHQIGGYADPVQGPVEAEVAHAALANQVPYGDPRLDEEARRWELLFQVDTDGDLGMEWGDGGVLYWMTRVTDDQQLGNAEALGQTSFTWQCA